jgi:hypothetical protein
MTHALTGYAAYLPRYRLSGVDIGLLRGDRVVASFDEDSTTMAVAAAAEAIDGHRLPTNLYFATSSPAYADKTNATAIHAALGLGPKAFVTDMCGTGRSAFAAWGLRSPPEVLPWPRMSASDGPGRPMRSSVATARRPCCSATAPPSPMCSA